MALSMKGFASKSFHQLRMPKRFTETIEIENDSGNIRVHYSTTPCVPCGYQNEGGRNKSHINIPRDLALPCIASETNLNAAAAAKG